MSLAHSRLASALAVILSCASFESVQAQLFDNLKVLSNRTKVGDPHFVSDGAGGWTYIDEHPKGLAAADFDGDGKADWAVSRLDGKIVIAWGMGDGKFEPLQVETTGGGSLRQLIAADLDGDGRVDLAAAEPFQGKIYFLMNAGGRGWTQPAPLVTWEGARNLEVLDWDGDGVRDLIVGGSDKDITRNFDKPWLPPDPPTVPQPQHGVVFFRGMGGGNFEMRTNFPVLAVASEPPDDEDDSFPRPIYVMKRWRPQGQTQDWVLATHALEEKVWILRPGNLSEFLPRDAVLVELEGLRTMALGAVTAPAGNAEPDLVVASRDLGTVIVFRLHYEELGAMWERHQQIDVPGGPRALEIADLNGDGWNEVIVVSRNEDRVVVLKNDHGTLARESDTVTGHSPRELAGADFDNDGRTDFVVLNRDSSDVSVLLAAAVNTPIPRTGFAALDQTYPVDGDIAQLGLHDLNGDGRDDVLQLHRSSAEVSVRLAGDQGRLGEPALFKMGDRPSAFSLGDINNDGKLDLVTANLGDAQGGLMVVRLGDGAGGFGAPQNFRPPEEPPPPTGGSGTNDPSLPPGVINPPHYGALYAVLTVDLDGDGNLDLVAGYYDCRIIFFKGDGLGHFTPTPGFSDHELYFLTGYEARFLVAADFDQDGDNDLAMAAWPGDVVVLENTGNFFLQRSVTDRPYVRHFFPRFDNRMARARDIQIVDVNTDGDPDLLVGTGLGTQILLGKSGVDFERQLYPQGPGDPELPVVPTISFPIAAMVTADLDDDGTSDDVAAICANDGCLNILTLSDDGVYTPVLVVDAPLTQFLAAGDIDGDGKTDLVGTGGTLWVALSSRRTAAAPPPLAAGRPYLSQLVINEIQPQNSGVPVPDPNDPTNTHRGDPEYVELFNGTPDPIPCAGWKLQLIKPDGTNTYNFPVDATLAPGSHQIIRCVKDSGRWESGFKMPIEGATLQLLSPVGALVDQVTYPSMQDNYSFARYSDADPTFRINHLPDPGRANVDNGAIEPIGTLNGIGLSTFAAGMPLRFYATARDDVGLVGMTVHWRMRGQAGASFNNALLFDDGMSGDGGRLDGVFSGVIDSGLFPGNEIEFYLECEDLSGEKKFVPGQPSEASGEGLAVELYTLQIPCAGLPASLEISEVLPANQQTVFDDSGEADDYVEVRNVSAQPVSLHGFELAENLFGGSRRLKFNDVLIAAYPRDEITLQPGAHRLLFCDGDDGRSPTMFHAPFRLNADRGGQIFLVRRTALGTQDIVDFSVFPISSSDVASSRLGVGGRFFCLPPTPGTQNVAPGSLIPMLENQATGLTFLLGIPTQAGRPVVVEASDNLQPGAWLAVPAGPTGDGFERLIESAATGPHRFFRLRE
jgi:FG-GAP-like repeat/Lamin Tail Domain